MIHPALALPLLLAGAAAAPARRERPPSLLLVLADDLGWGDLGCYGQERIATPNLDRLAAEGTRFTAAYAGSTVCAPSRCVLMTGMHCGHAYIRGNAKTNLRPADVTVAEVLRGAGYRTALFGKWGLGHEGSDGVPTRQGFERFFGFLDQTHAHNSWPSFLMDGEERVALPNVVPDEGPYGQGVASEKVVWAPGRIFEEAEAWLRGVGDDEPFFLYFATTIPHANNQAGRAGMEIPSLGDYADRDWPEQSKAYAALVGELGREVGSLLALLDELGRREDTLVLFTSDNGPHREGGNDPDFFDSNGPWQGIKRSLHEGGIRVPWIARWPGVVPAGATDDAPVSFADVLATAAALAGAEAPEGTDSRDLLPTLRGAGPPPAAPLYWEFYEGKSAQAVRFGRWKAIRSPMPDGPLALYDLAEDPGEERDVAAERPEEAARAAELLERSHVPSPLWKVRGK